MCIDTQLIWLIWSNAHGWSTVFSILHTKFWDLQTSSVLETIGKGANFTSDESPNFGEKNQVWDQFKQFQLHEYLQVYHQKSPETNPYVFPLSHARLFRYFRSVYFPRQNPRFIGNPKGLKRAIAHSNDEPCNGWELHVDICIYVYNYKHACTYTHMITHLYMNVSVQNPKAVFLHSNISDVCKLESPVWNWDPPVISSLINQQILELR